MFNPNQQLVFQLRSNPSMVLSYSGSSEGDRQRVCSEPGSGHPGQRWYYRDGYLMNANTNTCITVDHDKSTLLLIAPANAPDQKWFYQNGHFVSQAHQTALTSNGGNVHLGPRGSNPMGQDWNVVDGQSGHMVQAGSPMGSPAGQQQPYVQQQAYGQGYPQQGQQQQVVHHHHHQGQGDDKYDESTALILLIVGLLTGLTGIHRIYAGDMGKGIFQIVLGPLGYSFLGWILLYMFPWFFIGYIWCLVDLCNINSYIRERNEEARK